MRVYRLFIFLGVCKYVCVFLSATKYQKSREVVAGWEVWFHSIDQFNLFIVINSDIRGALPWKTMHKIFIGLEFVRLFVFWSKRKMKSLKIQHFVKWTEREVNQNKRFAVATLRADSFRHFFSCALICSLSIARVCDLSAAHNTFHFQMTVVGYTNRLHKAHIFH